MSTLTKATAELTQQNLDSSSSPTVLTPKDASPGASPNPLCVEIPVRVRGMEGGAAVTGAADSANTFTEDTQTLILFPRGAVVRLAAPVKPAQELILTNLKSQQNVHCKVVSVRPSDTAKGYVELEFTHRSAGFWDDSVVAAKPSPSASAPAKAPSAAEPAAPAAALPAAGLKDPFGGNLKPPFDTIAQSSPALAPVKRARMQHVPVVTSPAASTDSASFAKFEESALAPLDRRPAAPAAGPKLDMQAAKNRIAGDLQPGRKWFLAGASIAAGVLAVAVGIFLYHSRPAITTPARANSGTPATEAAPIASVAPQVVVVKADESPSTSIDLPSAEPAAAAPVSSVKPSGMGQAIRNVAAKLHLSIGNSKLNSPAAARPIAGSTADELPAVTSDESSAPVTGAAVPGGMISNTAAPIAPPVSAPAPTPERPVGGQATLPRAISMVRPQYPAAAKAAHIEGDVTLLADIGASGKVEGMKVVSGPDTLQSAALEALRQWRYEPARLNGQAVTGQVQVTLKFRLQ